MELNDSQKIAVEHVEGPCLCLAGPGSGKTATLVLRIKRLIEKGIPAEKICVITFTKAAAMEMKERFNGICEQGSQVTFGTFHSLFWGILTKEYHLKAEDILMGARKNAVIKEAAKNCDFKDNGADLINILETEISFINNANIPIEEYISKQLDTSKVRQAYMAYEGLKEKYGVFDFDDMLIKALRLFETNKAVLEKWQMRFDYFLVDEMQDMNELQFSLIRLLSAKKSNLFCVGDDDQSIYGFRGANPDIMQEFPKLYPSCQTILLDTNYRCPSNVLQASLRLVGKNKNRFSKDITGEKEDGSIEILETKDHKDEAQKVLDKISQLLETGNNPDSVAVLYRNHSAVHYLLDGLLERNIPFYLRDRMPNIYTHFVIEDMMDYFQVAVGNSTRARMLNILNKPNRFLMRRCLEAGYSFDEMKSFYSGNEIMQRRVEAFSRDISLISKMSPYAAVNYIRQGVGYDNYIKEDCLSKGMEADGLLDILSFFADTVRDTTTLKKAIEKINYLRLKVDYENKNKNVNPKDKVGLYTLHASKGLEFKNVFIIGANEGMIPGKKAVTEADIEAERRLFYVGVTRSKENLFISYANEKNRDRLYPSRFINELDLDNYSSTKSPKASS